MESPLPLRARWCFFRAWLDAGPWLRAVPMDERCVMGSPLGYQCKRRAMPGLWCAKHEKDAAAYTESVRLRGGKPITE